MTDKELQQLLDQIRMSTKDVLKSGILIEEDPVKAYQRKVRELTEQLNQR